MPFRSHLNTKFFTIVISESSDGNDEFLHRKVFPSGRNLTRLRNMSRIGRIIAPNMRRVIPIDMRTDARPLETRRLLVYLDAESTYERLRFKSISRVHKGRGGRGTGKWRAVV